MDAEDGVRAVLKIISGGQTGVDRGALDAALEASLPVGGWCPRGRRAEDGAIASSYPLRETPSRDYEQRTRWNVRDSNGTLVLLADTAQGGTALTIATAEAHQKPLKVVHLRGSAREESAHATAAWVRANDVEVLNVAGPRESESAGIYEDARAYMSAVIAALTR